MATAEVALQAPARRRRPLRYFSTGLTAFAAAIVLAAFVPEFVRFAAGTFPIAPVLHVHAAMMMAWVGAFAVQAFLGASGRTALHRRFGPYAVGIGTVAWLSMLFVEMRVLVVHPVPTDPRELDWMLPGPLVYLTAPVFFVWALRERRRPQWHKRLMAFALFVPLLAPIERFLWIPADRGFLPFLAALDLCLLVPLAGYDLVTLRGRLHPATVRGSMLLFGSQTLLLLLWGSSPWRAFAAAIARAVHG